MCGLGITYKITNLIETETCGGFYKCFPGSELDFFNSSLASILLRSGIELEYFVPSGSIHNHLAFVTKDLLKSMDNNALGKWITSSYAMSKQKQLEFSKPFENSAPIHLSIWDEQEQGNMFYDPVAEYELSEKGYAFIAGVLAYVDELIAIIAATSCVLPKIDYKKKFSYDDDDSIISAPCYFFENGKMARSGWSKRCIFRGIDSKANLYIVTACIFAAGFEGIKSSYKIEDWVDENYGVYSSSLHEKMGKLLCCELFIELLGNSIMKELEKCLERMVEEENIIEK
jgi:glutamine synthetase